MLHLLPIRLLLLAFAALVALLVLTAFYIGLLGTKDAFESATHLIRWASSLSLGFIILTYAAWRWVPVIQYMIFPYLGGTWEGEVRFKDKNGNPDTRAVTLEAKHTLFGAKLLLESAETESWTLVVHAEKSPDFDRYKLYYVYLNQRREGVAGANETYRGLAIVAVGVESVPTLEGNYFTDTHRQGTLHLTQSSKTPFWKLWR